LFVALVVEVGLAEMVVGLDEVKVCFGVSVDQNFGEGEFVHTHF
jgi:hypothetical protein